ncbi:MAG: NAD(P)-dependent oxidoreductase [Ignavibacteria bacterium]
MQPVKILIADNIDTSGVKLLPPKKFEVKSEIGISNQDIIRSYRDYDVLLIRSVRSIDKSFIKNTSFKVIATGSKGTDHIDVEFAAENGIRILNADDSNNISAAEHTLALILAIEKRLLFSDKLVRGNRFGFYDYERNELYGKSIGIVGFGKVGSYVGKLCEAFGMKVYANDIDKKVIIKNKNFIFKSLNFLLKNCEFISIHIPLDKKNFHFFSKEKLRLLNKRSVLINTSRGDMIDEKYLIKMLEKNEIRFAGLDVFSGEPAVDKRLGALDNVVLSNHIAGKTEQSRRKVSENIFRQIRDFYS